MKDRIIYTLAYAMTGKKYLSEQFIKTLPYKIHWLDLKWRLSYLGNTNNLP